MLEAARATAPARPRNWWGIPETPWFRSMNHDERELVGFFIEQLEFRVDQFRIPPRELAEMLPQQSLMLKVAAEAISDARWDDRLALSTGVVIGIGLDLNTTNYHLRWSLEKQVREWRKLLAPGVPPEKLNQWIDELKNAVSRRGLGQPDHGLPGWHGGQSGCPRVSDRRSQFHRLVRRNIRASRPW